MKLLLTFGATREPIDGVRFITNFSTGQTGAALADAFAANGWDVTALCGQGSALPTRAQRVLSFGSFSDLDSMLQRILREEAFAAVIHLAAVSDFSVDRVVVNGESLRPEDARKIDSTAEVSLKLKTNPKIIDRLKGYSRHAAPTVVAFKLTNQAAGAERRRAVERLFSHSGVELVVHNDLSELRREGRHPFTLYSREGELATVESVAGLAERLNGFLRSKQQ